MPWNFDPDRPPRTLTPEEARIYARLKQIAIEAGPCAVFPRHPQVLEKTIGNFAARLARPEDHAGPVTLHLLKGRP